MTLDRGTILNNRYRIVEILGQGGMGSVYRAIDENLGVEVAAKENLFTTEEYARQFRREAIILANLRHPNLPRVTDHFVIEGQGQYLVMDYIEGEDLRQRMDRMGVISEEEAVLIGAAICDALSYLDSRTQPIVHRDIKPGNVKITSQGQIYLVDFGLAKVYQGTHATTTGARAMTPGYSPPEQYGTARTDNRSDIFSLGATLYAALTGAIPEDALARAMDQAELTTIRKHNPKISRRLSSVLEKALEVRPDDRYQSAEEFRQALLSVRGITRRKNGEVSLAPAPATDGETGEAQDYTSGSPAPIPYMRRPNSSSPLPLPASTPLVNYQTEFRPGPRRRKGGFLLALGFFIILFVLTALVYTYYPNLPSRAVKNLLPLAGLELPAVFQEITATHTNTPSPSPLPTATVQPTATATLPAPTATSAAPVVAPVVATPSAFVRPTEQGGGAGLIAFSRDDGGVVQVWVRNVPKDEAEARNEDSFRQITFLPEGACQPDWSPDGKRLVFISPCKRNQETYPGSGLFIINLDGNGLTPLTSEPGGDFDPDWSPDGTHIAFTSLRKSGRPRVYVIDLADNTVTRLSEQYSRDMQPSWSPDGSRIAMVTTRKGLSQIWVMNADGTNQYAYSRSGDMINTHPVWAPDGVAILFTQFDPDGGPPSIAIASYQEQQYNEYRFDVGPLPIREARFSPDGLWLVFESWPDSGHHDIYTIATSGASRLALTLSERPDFDPVWQPVPVAP